MSQPATFRIKWLKPQPEPAPKIEAKAEPPKQPVLAPQPVQPVNYGPPLWKKLHERALKFDPKEGDKDIDFLESFEIWLPCGLCRKDWQEMMRATPPDFSNYFAWTVDRHNEVNRRLGKPELTLAQAAAIWKK